MTDIWSLAEDLLRSLIDPKAERENKALFKGKDAGRSNPCSDDRFE